MISRTVVQRQKEFFRLGWTRSTAFRRRQLTRLEEWIDSHEKDIYKALKMDLGKSETEAYMTEIGVVRSEIACMKKHLKAWSKPEMKAPSIAQFPARTFICKEPYGSVLIMAPWNYPFQLSMVPLVAALAAGNCVTLKPSAYAPHTSLLLRMMADALFPPKYVAVVEGSRQENEKLLEQPFDYIFFTGSPQVGQHVMRKAADHLTPVSLELGGKSPCIVDETADIRLAARRIIWGKLVNAGQTCVAPDYVLVHRSVKEKLVQQMIIQIHKMYGKDPLKSEDYPKIVNHKHFDRLRGLMEQGTIAHGGAYDKQTLKIEPTIFTDLSWDAPVMQEEIFGPLLPVLTFYDLDEVVRMLRPLPTPLALYYFTKKKKRARKILKELPSGGGCINDTVIHLVSHRLPFGGKGRSGMGAYHGKYGFDTFTHQRSFIDRGRWPDVSLRYPPFKKWKKWVAEHVFPLSFK